MWLPHMAEGIWGIYFLWQRREPGSFPRRQRRYPLLARKVNLGLRPNVFINWQCMSLLSGCHVAPCILWQKHIYQTCMAATSSSSSKYETESPLKSNITLPHKYTHSTVPTSTRTWECQLPMLVWASSRKQGCVLARTAVHATGASDPR